MNYSGSFLFHTVLERLVKVLFHRRILPGTKPDSNHFHRISGPKRLLLP